MRSVGCGCDFSMTMPGTPTTPAGEASSAGRCVTSPRRSSTGYRRPYPSTRHATAHPNGVVAIDHIVAASPSLDRSVDALQRAGLDLRRIRDQPTPAGAPRQAFFRLGAEILELIQEPEDSIQRAGGGRDHPARFWGLAVRVADLDRTVELLGSHVSEIRPAVQPGRRIATIRRSAGLAVPLALMSIPG